VKTVLLVEDLTFSRAIMARALQSIENCTLIEVENGEQALEEIRNNSAIDVIISDILMPLPNGLELLKMVRSGKTPAARDTPFIIVSGTITDEIQKALDALNVSGAIAKPTTKDQLAAQFEQIKSDELRGGSSLRSIAQYESVEIFGLLESSALDRSELINITNNPETLIAFLGAVPILDGLERHELELLGQRALMGRYEANEIVDGKIYGNSLLPIITWGAAEFLQAARLPDGELVEHRVAHLEAGNALGTFNFMSLPKDYKHPKVRIIRATNVVVLNFEDADPNSEMSQIKAKVELTIGRLLAQRVTYSDKALAMTLTQQLAETRVKRAAGGYVIMMFVLLAIYTIGMRFLLDIELKGSQRTVSSVAMILTLLLPFVVMLNNGPIKAADLGLTFRGARTATIDAIVMSSAFVGLLVGLKAIMVTFVPASQEQTIFALSQDFARYTPNGDVDWAFYAISAAVYALFVPVQEVIARCGIQSLLIEFLYGSKARRALVAILVSNFVFAAAHTHLNVGIALATFVGGLFFGWLFYRNRSIIGVSVAHFIVGGTALFALGLEEFLR
jgi:CheY-like chemotaxis protein/membrane protease YdiL (CAAX protease family)